MQESAYPNSLSIHIGVVMSLIALDMSFFFYRFIVSEIKEVDKGFYLSKPPTFHSDVQCWICFAYVQNVFLLPICKFDNVTFLSAFHT